MPRIIPYIDTKISTEATISEVDGLLRVHDVSHIVKEYDASHIKCVAFKHNGVVFRIPAKVEAVYSLIATAKKTSPRSPYRWRMVPKEVERQWYEQAERCAWRNVLFWVKAQLALVELGMVTITEVFMPYILTGGPERETLYQRMLVSGFNALPGPSDGGQNHA